MAKNVTAYGFKGMSNLPGAAAKLLDDERQISPKIVLNADVTDGGAINIRTGFKETKALTNCHSLWAGSAMLCVAEGANAPQALFRIEGEQAWELCEVTGPRAPVNFVEIKDLVYASNPYWKAAYDLLGTLRSWGISLPPAPRVNLVDGDMPPGTYFVAYTNVEGGRLGGNGPLTKIAWEGESAGLQLLNIPSGALCWVTHPNGGELFVAVVSAGVISSASPGLQPLPTFTAAPPPGFSHFIYEHGRIWGARAKQLFFSDPNQYELFRDGNYLPFTEDLVLLAPVTGGLFANSLTSSWFLDGTDPAQMKMEKVGDGAIPGTLAMAQMSGPSVGGGYEISRKLTQMPSPVWMTKHGIVVGTHTGHVVHLTEAKVRINSRTQGAGLYRVQDGIPQVLMSLYGESWGTDETLLRIFEENKLFN
jgi:hypothetical protein